MRKENNKENNGYITGRYDHADVFATAIFATQSQKITNLENFIKEKHLWLEWQEFEQRSNENLRRANPLLTELKDYGLRH